ncbi:MAG TPA: DsbA family oxidoreductase [Jatrophihabitans sp.]|jgi:predicted DsbA family dithiol-disulfide isomerase
MKVEIWSDVVCPWCYLGKRRFEQALDGFAHRDEVDVVYRSFELDPSAARGTTAPTVEVLAGKYGMTPEQAADAQRQMEARAREDGLTFAMSDLRSGNTRDAHRLLHRAAEHGVQADLVERLHRAYFTESRSVFDTDSLADLAAEAGLDRATAAAVLAGDDYDDAVAEDEALARTFGVTGVPFFVIDRTYGVSGAQSAAVLSDVLDQIRQKTIQEEQAS